MTVVGIDYGLKGAVAVMDDVAAPSGGKVGRRRVRAVSIADLYSRGLTWGNSDVRGWVVYIEDFMLRFANKPQRDAAIRYGRLLERLLWLGTQVHIIRPAAWKRAMGLPADASYGGRKSAALSLARRLWPSVDFKRADQADAALIGEYGWRVSRA